MKEIIKVNGLTKLYKNGHGIKDVNFTVNKGEVFGYLGPNGAGKTTTIRHLLGFIKPGEGKCIITMSDGIELDTWKDSNKVQKKLGYLPGEIAMPEFMTGMDFIKYIYKLRKLSDWDRVKELVKYWEFDPNVRIKRMSKGMKQKVGLVVAFMHDPEVLILDEPTSGLDPLMQDKFIKLIQDSKTAGKTIIMSSHIFREIEKTCDRVAIIKNGEIISNIDMKEITYSKEKTFDVQFKNKEDFNKVNFKKFEIIDKSEKWNSLQIKINTDDVNEFTKELAKYDLTYMREIQFTLEEYFMQFYKFEGGEKDV